MVPNPDPKQYKNNWKNNDVIVSCDQLCEFGFIPQGNEPRKSEPARELLIFEYPAFANERSDLIG